jgi:hypothetical protein
MAMKSLRSLEILAEPDVARAPPPLPQGWDRRRNDFAKNGVGRQVCFQVLSSQLSSYQVVDSCEQERNYWNKIRISNEKMEIIEKRVGKGVDIYSQMLITCE